MQRSILKQSQETSAPSIEALGSPLWKGRGKRVTTNGNPESLPGYTLSRINDDFDLENQVSIDLKAKISEPKKNDSEIPNLFFDNHVDPRFKCKCGAHLCNKRCNYLDKMSKLQPTDFFHNFSFEKHARNNNTEKDFVFIIKKLIPPKQIPYALRIFIPETVAFIDGEAKFIVQTEKDRKLRFIKNKERLTLGDIKKFFQDVQRRRENELSIFDEKEIQQSEESEMIKREPLSLEKLEARLDFVIPEAFAPGLIPRAKNVKQKQIRNVIVAENSINKEVVLARFRDDTVTILSEVELNNIFLKRRNDIFWRKLQYLQMYIRIRRGITTMQRIYFVYEREKNDPLFQRCLTEIRYLNGEMPKASQEYIPLHEEERFEEELMKNNLDKYYLYLLMKIYHFIEVMYGIRILKMGGDFVKDPLGTTWLTNISRVEYETLREQAKQAEEVEQLFAIPKDLEGKEDHGSIILDGKTERTDREANQGKKRPIVRVLTKEIKSQYEKIKQNSGINFEGNLFADNRKEDEGCEIKRGHRFFSQSPKKFNHKVKEQLLHLRQKSGNFNPRATFSISSLKKSPEPIQYIKLESATIKVDISEEKRFRQSSSGPRSSISKDRYYLKRSIDYTSSGISPKKEMFRWPSQSRFELSQTSQSRGNHNKSNSRLIFKKNERYNFQGCEDNFATIEHKEVEKIKPFESFLEKEFSQLNRSNHFREFNVRKLDIEDLKRVILPEHKHYMWVKSLNRSVQNRISAQLSGRSFGKTQKEFYQRNHPLAVDRNL